MEYRQNYWTENSIAEDLWENHDWYGKATPEGTPRCCRIPGGELLKRPVPNEGCRGTAEEEEEEEEEEEYKKKEEEGEEEREKDEEK